MDTPIAVVTGWWLLKVFIGWCAASVTWGFVQAIYKDLRKANDLFDTVVAGALEHFPDAIIRVARGPLFWQDQIDVRIIKRKGPADPVEVPARYTWDGDRWVNE